MTQKISPTALIVAGVAVLLLLIIFGWRTVTSSGDSVDSKTIAARIAAKDAKWNGH